MAGGRLQAHTQRGGLGVWPGGGIYRPRPGGCIPASTEADTPQQTVTAVDGTHPTGTHSCCVYVNTLSYWVTEIVLLYNISEYFK